MKYRFLSLLLAVVGATSFIACNKPDEPAVEPVKERTVASVQLVASLTQAQVAARINAVLPGGSGLITSGVKAYKVTYKTTMLDGSKGNASGLLLVPSTYTGKLTPVSFQHGTIIENSEAPSAYTSNGYESYYLGTAMAAFAKGYAVVMPDYLGYGASVGAAFHPYIHRQTLGMASLDMLRAVKEIAADSSIALKDSIIIAGYSEGGYATMALHKTIDDLAPAEFKISRSFPGAGPYDVLSTAKQVLQTNAATDQMFVLSYVWVMLTYDKAYKINAALSSYLTTANIPAAQSLQRGAVDSAVAKIGNNPSQVFAPAIISGVVNETNTQMVSAVKDNNIYDWKPSGTVTLLHSTQDDWVPYANSRKADSAMRLRGANVTLVPLTGTHSGQGGSSYFLYVLTQLQ